MVVRTARATPDCQVVVQRVADTRMNVDEAALAEFRLTDQQPVGSDVGHEQRGGFGHPEAGDRHQSEHIVPGQGRDRTGRGHRQGRVQQVPDLFRRQQMRRPPSGPPLAEDISGRQLVAIVIGAQGDGEGADDTQLDARSLGRGRLRGPLDDPGRTDRLIAAGGGESREAAQHALQVNALVAQGSLQRDVAVHCRDQRHGTAPIHGCATRRSMLASTFA